MKYHDDYGRVALGGEDSGSDEASKFRKRRAPGRQGDVGNAPVKPKTPSYYDELYPPPLPKNNESEAPPQVKEEQVNNEPSNSRVGPLEDRLEALERAKVKREHSLNVKPERGVREDLGDEPKSDRKRFKSKIDMINLEPSGLLAAETNTRNGVELKLGLPAEARRPTRHWRLVVFKDTDEDKQQILPIDKLKMYVLGKDARVADIPLMHPTISAQHAAIVHRFVKTEVRPYIIDLESTNGTFLNGERIESRRFYELKERDSLKLAKSSRDYIVMPLDIVEGTEIPLETIVERRLKEEEEARARKSRSRKYR